jgi:hypothetical protein
MHLTWSALPCQKRWRNCWMQVCLSSIHIRNLFLYLSYIHTCRSRRSLGRSIIQSQERSTSWAPPQEQVKHQEHQQQIEKGSSKLNANRQQGRRSDNWNDHQWSTKRAAGWTDMVAATREEKFPSAPWSPLETKGAMPFMLVPPLVENYAKKNHNHFPIAVLLTTLIWSR